MNIFLYATLALAAVFFIRAGWQLYYKAVYEKPVRQLIDSQKEITAALERIGTSISELSVNINALMTLPTHELIGMASWYGEKFEGRPMASGRPLDGSKLTAAHPSLPIGTTIKVVNLNNRREVLVEITDRGPFHGSRMLDLSEAAALELGMKKPGVCPVRITVLTLPFREMMSYKLSEGD
jgi:rare lipoprotein A (peptidoglycan hydrolase)